jgi:hypothetical protein
LGKWSEMARAKNPTSCLSHHIEWRKDKHRYDHL